LPFVSTQILQYRQEFLSRLETRPFPPSDVTQILRYGAPAGSVFESHEYLDRCMSRLQKLMAAAEERGRVLPAGTVVAADRLGASTGRFNRHWHAPLGGLWLAMAWPDVLLSGFSRLLPFAAGLACCRAIRGLGVDACLKWVNDLLVGNRKVGGILCETVVSPAGEQWHILGIGINVNNCCFPADLQLPATCMQEVVGEPVDLARFMGRLLAEFSWSLGLLHFDEACSLREQRSCEEGRRSLLLSSWLDYCDSIGRRVEYGFDVLNKPMYKAIVRGIDPCGALQMTLADGTSVTEFSGEIRYLDDASSS
jgi:BirA family biotin operon repressor/biotin-[acetyl-CoA-carboxylase] ligase